MNNIQSYQDLIVWQKAMEVATTIYTLTQAWPQQERYGRTAQITRAAVSVPANIAEGYSRNKTGEYAHFLSIARGSLAETETLLVLALRLAYLTSDQTNGCLGTIEEVSKMLNRLRARVLAAPRR